MITPSVITPIIARNCPHCGAYALAKNGKSNAGHQRYKCQVCDKNTSDSPKRRGNNKPACPKCGEKLLSKIGFTTTGYQRYSCKSCGKKSSNSPFLKGNSEIANARRYRRSLLSDREILALRSDGKLLREIAELAEITEQAISNRIKRHRALVSP